MNNKTNTTKPEPTLVGIETCIEMIWGESEARPSIRTFNAWKALGYFPSVKIGRRVFLNVEQVKKALEKRFTINAID